MTKLFSVVLVVIFGSVFGKTIDPEKKQLFQKANYEIILQPDRSLEVLDYIEKNFPLDNDERDKLDYLKIKSFFFQNDMTQVFKKISRNDNDLPAGILILKRSILYSLNIEDKKEITEIQKTNDLIFSEEIMQLLNDLGQKKIKDPTPRLSYILKKAGSSNLVIARENLLYLSDFLAESHLDTSPEFFLNGLMGLYKNDPDFSIVYAKYLILHNDPESARKIIDHLPKEALEQSTNPNLRYNYYDLLIDFYYKTGEYDNYKEFIDKKELVFKSIDKVRFSAKNKWFNIVEENLRNDQRSLLAGKRNILFLIMGFGSIIIILITIRFFQIDLQIREYQNFISKINILKEKKTSQPQIISERTENILLKKLDDFEKTDAFTKPDISLQTLAKKLETNTKYLSETINNQKQKNFNAYINELRINYIINKLKKNPVYRSYKIKYLAEESGFSTHSAFAAVFKSVTGMSPINYIQLLKQKEE